MHAFKKGDRKCVSQPKNILNFQLMNNHQAYSRAFLLHFLNLPFLCLLILVSSGCSTAKQTERKAAMATKETNFNALNTAVMGGELKPGLSGQEIQARFGEPDDIYRLISQTSVTEIWTYQRPPDHAHSSQWRPIRITFENHKLLNISY
ncbi:MAG TPA: hypothetical protein PLB05_05090 [Candidatus Omnitrophota bacterium]|nr:hypothetical protein [Candidatus Omnitrophota bacterium]